MTKITKNNKLKLEIVKELRNKTVLITGGGGSIGTALTKNILKYPIKQVRVIDIDEHALFSLGRVTKNHPKLRLLLGSILDKDRLEMACNNVDIIIHLAAIKNIEISEFNPIETIDTNINGIVNLMKIIMKTKPKKFLNLSGDIILFCKKNNIELEIANECTIGDKMFHSYRRDKTSLRQVSTVWM